MKIRFDKSYADWIKKNRKESIFFLLSFSFFLYMALHRLTQSPIWLDEALEYYISKYMVGTIPWFSNTGVPSNATNMYERMLEAFQPPLYNFAMYFWLLLGDSEWWFRFSNVVMSAIGVIGLYKIIKHISTYRVASISVVIYSCVYNVIYFTQECAEYSMLLMFLPWTFYVYFLVLEHTTFKRMVWFGICCVLIMYTQYGAMFIVFPLTISVLLHVIWNKNKKQLKQLAGIYTIALVGFGIPLIFLFVIPQILNPVSTFSERQPWDFYNGSILSDFIHMLMDVFRWNTIESMTRFYTLSLIACSALNILAIYCLKQGKSKVLKHLIICNIVTWLSYYIMTRAEIYAYGYFGARYNLFFIPMWMITIVYMFYEAYQTIGDMKNKEKQKMYQSIYKIVVISMATLYCVYGAHQINKHWEKADTKGCVETWYEQEGYQTLTLVNDAQAPAFTYYFTHNEKYEKSYENNIIRERTQISYNEADYDNEYHKYKKYLDTLFGDNYPEAFYYFVGDGDRCRLLNVMKDKGYQIDTVYRTTAQLYYIHK